MNGNSNMNGNLNVNGGHWVENFKNSATDGYLTQKKGLDDDILEGLAIVGFALRFPQEAVDAESFWTMLMEGRCAMTEFPSDRINLDAFYHPDSDRLGTIPLKGGHFLQEAVDVFDATFFSITGEEAAGLDPQHRILLETTYLALENAGIPMEKIARTKTSVHTGCFTSDYTSLFSKDPDVPSKYAGVGTAAAMLANRISWFFDLTGPSVNLDSACSSSMMALDIACQGLWNGDIPMAIVAGSNLVFGLDYFACLSNMGFLSTSSRCFSFDNRANGYARGEGVGVLIIKRIRDAIRDGDPIRAVIRSTGSNQDGHTPGVTQPSKDSQEQLIRDTYSKAGLSMHNTMFFESHGTGTLIGDPTEASAIGAAFGRQHTEDQPLIIGAVKANIGHLEGASGVAGFPSQALPWPTTGLRRASVNSFGFGGANSHAILDDAYHYLLERSLTSSYSLNGFNNHPTTEYKANRNTNEEASIEPKLLVWSASEEEGLDRLAAVYSKHFERLALQESEVQVYLTNLAYTLSMRRSSLSWKSFTVTNSPSKLGNLQDLLSKPVRSSLSSNIGFVFTGQGAQWPKMGEGLLVYPTFRKSLEEADGYLRAIGCEWSLLDELLKEKTISQINSPAYSQPLCTALQVALVDLLKSFGVVPSGVVGHSSGEIAAAYATGAISNQSALKIAYHRGKLTAALLDSPSSEGAMMAVGLSEEDIKPYLTQLPLVDGYPGVIVGCINSSKNITLSGNPSRIDFLKTLLDADLVFARKLQVNAAYHSPYMEKIASQYLDSIQDIYPGDTSDEFPMMISSVTGAQISGEQLRMASYWVQNMVSQVQFMQALKGLCSYSSKRTVKKIDGSHRNKVSIDTLLEIGPHSALHGPIKDILREVLVDKRISYASLLSRGVSAMETMLEACGLLHCVGYPIILEQVNRLSSKPCLNVLSDLPAYPFNHFHSYWYESRLSSNGYRLRKVGPHDLLGTIVPDWNPSEARWRNILKSAKLPWIKDHKINGSSIYPAVGMLVMAIEGAKQLADKNKSISGFTIKDAFFSTPVNTALAFEGVETQLHLKSHKNSSDQDDSWSEFKLYTLVGDDWVENCHGSILVEYDRNSREVKEWKEGEASDLHYQNILQHVREQCRHVDTSYMYQRMDDYGYNYGPSFRPLHQISCTDNKEAIAKVRVFEWLPVEYFQPHVIHPTTFDGIFQLIFTALTNGGVEDLPTFIPTHVHKIWVSNSGLSSAKAGVTSAPLDAYVKSSLSGFRLAQSSLFVLDTNGKLCMTVDNLETTIVANISTPNEFSGESQRCYLIDWKPDIQMAQPAQMKSYCESNTDTTTETEEFYRDLTLLLFLFIHRAVDALSTQEPERSPSHIIRYIEWMRKVLLDFQNGTLPDSNLEWIDIARNYPERLEQLCDRLEHSRQGRLFIAIGRNLLKILHGEIDPLTLLFEGDLAKDYYQDIFDSILCISSLRTYVDALAHGNPGQRILEVGAGTGSMTTELLETLLHHGDGEAGAPRYATYDFTDISPSFFEKGKELFKSQASRMNFKVLNIEDDPILQGFDPSQYDLAIAHNVLHATKNLDMTLQNTRKLLKPGGKLILFEVTQPEKLRVAFAFGLLPGWWLGTEEIRNWSPCISKEEWHRTLLKNGFSGSEIVFDDYEDPLCHELSFIISTATATDAMILPSSPPQQFINRICIINGGTPFQTRVTSQIQNKLRTAGNLDCITASLLDPFLSTLGDSTLLVFLPELEKPLLSSLDDQTFQALKSLLSLAVRALWVTCGGGNSPGMPDYGMIEGLARVLRVENRKLSLVTLALEIRENSVGRTVDNIIQVLSGMVHNSSGDYEREYREIDGILQISRVIEAKYLDDQILQKTALNQYKVQPFGYGEALKLTPAVPGLLNNLIFVEDQDYLLPLSPGEIEIEVKAVGINYVTVGRVNQNTIGVECAGIVTRIGCQTPFKKGDHVIAGAHDTFRTFARVPAECAIAVPKDLPFIEAAALPINFITTWHALHEVARIQPGESILIHSGAGGTGQAAIQIAKYKGAEVYTTVGSKEKMDFLMASYRIPRDHIFYSRGTSFAEGVKRATKGRGVDVVLNTLVGEGLVASWELVAPYGRFVEISIKDIEARRKLPMFPFAENVSFSAIDIGALTLSRTLLVRKALEGWMPLYLEGKFHPAQPITRYGLSNVEEAFRSIQSGSTIGKVVVEMSKEDLVTTVMRTRTAYNFSPDATYLICGGLGGIGRSIAKWLVNRGAKHLLLLSRSGSRSDATQTFVAELRSEGINVQIPECDIADPRLLASVLERSAQTMPPVKGCIQAAMVLKASKISQPEQSLVMKLTISQDSVFANMSFESWSAALAPKVQGSWNLHTQLRDLDFFILLSSVTGVLGSVGQANYSAGNTYQDALARYRVSQGQKTVSLDLGAVKGEGFIAENDDVRRRFQAGGYFIEISQEQLFALLDYYCDPSLPLPTSKAMELKYRSIIGLNIPSNLSVEGTEGAHWMHWPLFSHLHQIAGERDATGASSSNTIVNYGTALAGAESLASAGEMIAQMLLQKLSRAFSISEEQMDISDSLHLHGVDSLVAVELRNWFGKEFGADVAIFDLLRGANFSTVGMTVAAKSPFCRAIVEKESRAETDV
ncbi:hypothetical protein G7Y89_g8896 [Cudoniella acicularis]|uniref:Carrier domain-containing protein n=1 Tax=Cudoniella acicularis TaxID=354080 RepID=A0A8H4RFQ8_9HELO|nr:hypothetical protein G7Y89_g8896 [Cudoniella acicularis]